MLQLSEFQKRFFRRHNISLDEVFDATGMSSKEWKNKIRVEGKKLAVAVTPCKKERHEIRTRAGHCAACDPSKIAFSQRKYLSGIVYLLISRKSNLIKIGVTTDIEDRLNNLNSQCYGNADDWQLLRKSPKIKNAGALEKNIQNRLSKYCVKGLNSIRAGIKQSSLECYQCDFQQAIDAMDIELSHFQT